MKLKKLLIAGVMACSVALPMSSANAFWGGNSWMPWNWFDDDYYYRPYGPWGGYPGYGYGGYPGYGYGGYPGYGWGGYPYRGW